MLLLWTRSLHEHRWTSGRAQVGALHLGVVESDSFSHYVSEAPCRSATVTSVSCLVFVVRGFKVGEEMENEEWTIKARCGMQDAMTA